MLQLKSPELLSFPVLGMRSVFLPGTFWALLAVLVGQSGSCQLGHRRAISELFYCPSEILSCLLSISCLSGSLSNSTSFSCFGLVFMSLLLSSLGTLHSPSGRVPLTCGMLLFFPLVPVPYRVFSSLLRVLITGLVESPFPSVDFFPLSFLFVLVSCQVGG